MKFRRGVSLRTREQIAGYTFVLPFVLGFGLFFLYPFILSIVISLSELQITRDGWELHYVGWQNYRYAFVVHTTYVRQLVETLGQMLINMFFIFVFSLAVALLLKGEFRGRLFVRVVVFLPVIIGSGIVLYLEQQDVIMRALEFATEVVEDTVLSARFQDLLVQVRLPEQLTELVFLGVDRIPVIVRSSSIQILVFLAGLQAITPSIYEAASVEGATAWETFWLVTLPMLGPLILANTVYTVVAFLTSTDNAMITLIRDATFGGPGYAVGTAMAWFYFVAIAAILLLVVGITSRFIFYHQ